MKIIFPFLTVMWTGVLACEGFAFYPRASCYVAWTLAALWFMGSSGFTIWKWKEL